jgi:integrase
MHEISFSEFAAQTFAILPVTKKTVENYEGSVRRHFNPVIGSIPVSKISKNQLVKILEKLPPHTHYQALMAVRVIFREALYRELIEESPAASIRTPKTPVKPYNFLTWESLQTIDFGYQTTRIRFLALHGLRWGEAAALRDDDIYDGLVHVSKSVHGATKSKAGVREVPYISDFQPFPRYQKSVAKALRPHGVTIHSLRKTYAYTLKSANVHVTTAAKLLGHSNPLVTMKIYTAVLDDETVRAGEAVKSFIMAGQKLNGDQRFQ